MGLGQYTSYKVQPPFDMTTEKIKSYTLQDLEIQALERRKILGFVDKKEKQDVVFLRNQVSAILPDVEFGYEEIKDYDYFRNQSWEEAGLKISWNIISLLNTMENAITKEEKTDLMKIYSMATGTAVLSEVNIAYLRFQQALKNFQIVLLLSEVKEDIARQSQLDGITNITDLEIVSKQIEALLSKTKIYYAYGELKDAEDILLISVGIKNYPSFINKENIKVMIDGEKEIETETWANGTNWLEQAVPLQTSNSGLKDDEVIASKKPLMLVPAKKEEVLIDVKNYTKTEATKPAKAKVSKAKIFSNAGQLKILQLGSFKDEEKANQGWNTFVEKNPDLQNYNHNIVIANVVGVGKVYRLMVEGNLHALKEICAEFSNELGNSCLIR